MGNIPLPTIIESLEFRMDQMSWTQTELGKRLGLQRSHMSEVLNGKREMPLSAIRKAYKLGVPAKVLLQ